MKIDKTGKLVLVSLLLSFYVSALYPQQLAFPTAEGHGKYTKGGRGGAVYEVTNLNNSGAGSLRDAVSKSGPRTIVFRVSGTINLSSNLDINRPYITIAGQTAPGDGICLKGKKINIAANEVIIRYIRVRPGSTHDDDAISNRFNKNIILDHVSASWTSDETVSLYHGEKNTIQWCMITESLNNANHGFAGIWGSDSSTYHHNLIAHHRSRNPRWASGCQHVDYRNNVLYNWGGNSCYGGEAQQPGDARFTFSTINMVANYYKAGPATGPKSRIADPSSRNGDADAGQWWISDNYVAGYPNVTADNWLGVTTSRDAYKLAEPWPAMAINQQTAEEAYMLVLADAGCSLPKRDSVDMRIIEEVRNGTTTYGNGIINSQTDVGGWPVLNSLPAPADADHDGMPNDWEAANGLDSLDAEDRNIVGPDGYTNLEIYLNSMIEYPTDIRGMERRIPDEFILAQNYPNPFNPTTKIDFSTPKKSRVKLEIFDVTGKKVATLIDEVKEAGNHSINFNGSNLSTGIYVYKLTTANNMLARKMLFVK